MSTFKSSGSFFSFSTRKLENPGNILSIKVTGGQSVKAGDVLIIIEAMKMENEVLAPQDGVVKQILVSKGAVVATGDVLVVI